MDNHNQTCLKILPMLSLHPLKRSVHALKIIQPCAIGRELLFKIRLRLNDRFCIADALGDAVLNGA